MADGVARHRSLHAAGAGWRCPQAAAAATQAGHRRLGAEEGPGLHASWQRVFALEMADGVSDRAVRGRRGLEMLIRKLLQLPSRPAILMLNLWMPSFNRYSFWEARTRPPSFTAPAHLALLMLAMGPILCAHDQLPVQTLLS